jgi:hypothetical protein
MSSKSHLYPLLFSVVGELEKYKVHIATSWVKRENIQVIFEERKISAKKFRDGYGVPILEYFISVIQEKKPLGDCPVMSKLVHFLLKKRYHSTRSFQYLHGLTCIIENFFIYKRKCTAKSFGIYE